MYLISLKKVMRFLKFFFTDIKSQAINGLFLESVWFQRSNVHVFCWRL